MSKVDLHFMHATMDLALRRPLLLNPLIYQVLRTTTSSVGASCFCVERATLDLSLVNGFVNLSCSKADLCVGASWFFVGRVILNLFNAKIHNARGLETSIWSNTDIRDGVWKFSWLVVINFHCDMLRACNLVSFLNWYSIRSFWHIAQSYFREWNFMPFKPHLLLCFSKAMHLFSSDF